MRTALLFIFAVAFLAITEPVLAQGERMTEADYNTAVVKALEASSARNRRVLTKETFYDGTQVRGTRQIVSEFAGPDAKRIDVTEDFRGTKSKKTAAMKIADQIFCKEDKEDWKRSSKDCSNGMAMAIPDGNYKYTMEPDPNDASRKVYWRRATFVDEGVAERDAARLKFIEIKITVDDNGIVEYVETRRGGIEPDGWSSVQVTRYEYDPKDLKIDTPSDRL